MAATSNLKLVLKMDDDKSHAISLADPKTGLTRAEVTNFGNLLIAKEAIVKNNALPVSVKDAYIAKAERVELAG